MKLLVGCLILGCIFAVLVIAEDSVTETVQTTPELTTAIVAETPEPEKETRNLAKTDQGSDNDPRLGVYIVPEHHDDHHHHHHPTEPPHHHHHTPPPHHHHHPQPPHPPYPPHHHHYPPYYPPYYPPPYPYAAPVYAPVAQPYPYYPSPQYPPSPHMHIKPITMIQTETDSNSGSGPNIVKPSDLIQQSTGYLWNLFDQKNNELWNFFGNVGNGGGGVGKAGNVVHEVVLTYEKPEVGTTIGTVGQPNGGNWFYKAKNIPKNDCNTTK